MILFVKNIVLLASLDYDRQRALEGFEAECEEARMRISSSKFEAKVFN